MLSRNLTKVADEELVTLVQKGDTYAFEELFNRYWEKLFISADKFLRDEEASKDMIQDIFIDLWERRTNLLISNLNAYLIQSVKYKIASYFRKEKYLEGHQTVIDSLKTSNSTEEWLKEKELNQAISDELKNIPDRCREIFYFSRFQHLSNKEIADRFGISVRTVETQISKALKHLRANLEISTLILFAINLS